MIKQYDGWHRKQMANQDLEKRNFKCTGDPTTICRT